MAGPGAIVAVMIAAREADEYICALEGVYVTRLPLGSGMTIITKLA